MSRTAVSKWGRNVGYPNIDSLKYIVKVFSILLSKNNYKKQLFDLGPIQFTENIKSSVLQRFLIIQHPKNTKT